MNTINTSWYVAKAVAVGFVWGVLITLPAVVVAFASTGAGHGHYLAARVLFPAPMLLTRLDDDTFGPLIMGAGLLQFPIYGALLGWVIARKSYFPAVAVTFAHIAAASACFAGTLPNFS